MRPVQICKCLKRGSAAKGRTMAFTALVLGLLGLGSQSATAGLVYASSVVSGPAGAGATLGAPDGGFIQLTEDVPLILSFSTPLAGSGTLRIFNIDTALPAAAKIEVSSNGSSFFELVPPTGQLWYDSNPGNFFDIQLSTGAGSSIQFVRFTDLPPSIDGDNNPGFDIDAVGYLPGAASVVPEPSSLILAGLGVPVFVAYVRYRKRETISVLKSFRELTRTGIAIQAFRKIAMPAPKSF